ncbi:MAG TPA: hypothetical protein DIV40_09360 [Clostridiales bacterium]|jgi:hypothetical protein|nr:hypothetical protein [Clostridiales bacterium]
MKIDLAKSEERIIEGLKDFQRATVDRVIELYKGGQNRVLVADEVGLGKTLVAKGVIAKTARLNHQNGDELFKVVYICSNLSIANQNINKLKISDDITVDGVSDTRLSMQHLKIFEQEYDDEIKERYVQIIPLTPVTSFAMTGGSGSKEERALIYAVLRRIDIFSKYLNELEVILIDSASVGWKWVKQEYENRVTLCCKKTSGVYISEITKLVKSYIKDKNIFDEMLTLCSRVRENGGNKIKDTRNFIYKLRMMFAQISVEFLNPDLVIMDEFQRFKFLISADELSETGILAKRFLNGNGTKVLLLSATPYKLYSTLEEINESQIDEHYSEFIQVMNFLIDNEKRLKEFKNIWSNLSMQLREIDFDNISVIEAKKKAESAMYNGVCRTERIAAINNGDFINDESARMPISVTEKDIISYVEADKLLNNIGANNNVPVDYVKSAPYILSFMKQYKMKKQIEKYFKNNRDEIKAARSNNLWINEGAIKNYKEIHSANGRLERLKEVAFENKAEMLLWVPPSMPYYEPHGPYKNAANFSKILVFSAWEMVPRMIATLISYEAERKTVGKIVEQNRFKLNTSYFAPNNKRYPVARLRFNVDNNLPQSMSMFCLLYPSKTLAELYNPIEYMNQGKSLKDIEKDLAEKINDLLKKFQRYQGFGNRDDERWYYLALLLFDSQAYITTWFHYGAELISGDTDEEEKDRGQKGFLAHLMKLREYNDRLKNMQLGKMPKDLTDVLVNMAIASPAICAYRANGQDSLYATQISKLMINMFNKQESIAVIDLCYGRKNSDAYWKNVLNYCKDGNLQSVLDEYVHMIAESNGYNDSQHKYKLVHSEMMFSMKMHTSSYNVDTYNKFKDRALNKRDKGINMRSHYAVGFYKDEGDSSKNANRKESIRSSFNSPFRPFVLATTSIGQEGLDFHYYCRKVMHWNLPSNPIDLEQREGRINRFKCLAIRQNVALKYRDNINFKKDVWEELFVCAKEEYKDGYSELIPFWCLPDDQGIKIERIIASYPLSKDIGNYQRLIKILSLYRLTLGQARQEELLEHIFKNCKDSEKLKDLFINLSPYYREKNQSREVI